MSAPGDIVFRADSVCKTFGGRTILTSASLWARRGAVTVLFGRNGSGKSTLMKVGAGLVQPDQGVVLFGGRAWPRPRLHALGAAGLFFLPERDLLVRDRTVGEHLQAVVRRYGGDATPHVEALQVESLLGDVPATLSGGERRRAELAIALTRAPICLIADEPFMGIAPADIEMLSAALGRLRAAGCAIVMSGHEVPALMNMADEVVWLTAGTTHSLGSAADACQNWQFRKEYAGLRAGSRTVAW
jgi:lipopolysaccharide export system ATP-binding protein